MLRLLHNSLLFDTIEMFEPVKVSTMSFDIAEKYRSSGFSASNLCHAQVSRGWLHI